ncbi:MAG TPA: hypothetical protein PKC12_06370, partial [Thiobacillaceae bacterium]|nr:hypothetical protein [Thiobacillaceae bacterium]
TRFLDNSKTYVVLCRTREAQNRLRLRLADRQQTHLGRIAPDPPASRDDARMNRRQVVAEIIDRCRLRPASMLVVQSRRLLGIVSVHV